MSKIVLCMDNGNSCVEETKKYLEAHDCKVYAFSKGKQDVKALAEEVERKEGRVDLLLLGVNEQMAEDGAIGEAHDCEKLLEEVSGQINSVQEAIDTALPLLRKGTYKRIGMITKRESSISNCKDDRNYGRHMALAGFNMVGKLYFNRLRKEGFRFRWYCGEENSGGMSAGEYLLSDMCYDEKEPYNHSDENRMVMRDAYLKEIAW